MYCSPVETAVGLEREAVRLWSMDVSKGNVRSRSVTSFVVQQLNKDTGKLSFCMNTDSVSFWIAVRKLILNVVWSLLGKIKNKSNEQISVQMV